ncbi:MAG: ABC transporter ATP-binding protein [Bryobacterales bacterium]|jgi:lipopolysaccharide transport system ATP-binding protein|nr:ABC transporter ATP-binding protein [Bryobacterales bacterium]
MGIEFKGIEFKKVTLPPLVSFSAAAPRGSFIGIIGEDGAGKSALLRLAAGADQPVTGSVSAGRTRRLLGPEDPLTFPPADLLLFDHTFARHDAAVRARALTAIGHLRREGTTVLLVSHEEPLLERTCDEIWWLHEGKLRLRAEPEAALRAYREHIAERVRAWGNTAGSSFARRESLGDERCEITGVETLGAQDMPTSVWRSGERVAIRITARFRETVADPVFGILIRNRIGLDVYGTNTQLEEIRIGPCNAGRAVRLTFSFDCHLCPGEYTITVASHDPDGTRHDWLEEAVAVAVTAPRYTAGVANLQARVTLG